MFGVIDRKTVPAAWLLGAALVLGAGSAAVAQDDPTLIPDSPYTGKTLVVSMQYDWEPLSFRNDAGEPTGYFYDIVMEAIRRLGATAEVTSGDFAAVIPAIQSGKFDTAVGLDATVQRQEVIDVVAHSTAGYRFLTKADSPLPADADFSALCGMTIATLASHPAQHTLEGASADCVAAGKEPIKVDYYPDRAANFLAVKSGRADVTTGYTGENGWLVQKDPELKIVGPIFDTAYAGVPLPKGSPAAASWQAAFDAMIADGTYGEILTKYGVEDTAIPASIINPAK